MDMTMWENYINYLEFFMDETYLTSGERGG